MEKEQINKIISNVDTSIKMEGLNPTKLSDKLVEQVLNDEISVNAAVEFLMQKYKAGEYNAV